MTRSLTALAVLLCVSLCGATAADPIAGKKPNIVFVLTDDQGYGDISAHGNPVLKTPNLDKLHAEGVRFTDFHVSPTCSPTRSALLTGRHEFKNGVTHTILERERLTPQATTLAQVLKSAGYTTGIFGKWHLGDEPDRWPDKRGFDELFIHGCGGIGQSYPGSCGDVPGNSYFDPTILHNGTFEKTKGYCTDVFFGQATKWIEGVKGKGKPFFLFMSTHNIHVPRVPNAKFKGKSDCGVRGDAIVEFDWMVGQVLDYLDKLKLTENTLMVLTSDNGGINDDNGPDKVHGIGDPDATNGHKPNGALRGTKATVYEGGTRVPFIVRWPAKVKPGTSDALMSQMDLLASFAALTGQAIPKGQAPDSENHIDALLGAKKTGREFLVEQSNGGAPFGFRHGTWKLVPGGPKTKEVGPALFDLATDPGEAKNVAAANPDRTAAMRAKLAEITGQPLPKKDKNAEGE